MDEVEIIDEIKTDDLFEEKVVETEDKSPMISKESSDYDKLIEYYRKQEELSIYTKPGFGSLNDIDNYIKDLETQKNFLITELTGVMPSDALGIVGKQGLNERLEELNEQIELKYANYRNGAKREADPEIEKLEEEYIDLLILQEKSLVKQKELEKKIKEAKEERERVAKALKNKLAFYIKERKKYAKYLKEAQDELKNLKNKVYNGDKSLATKERIEVLETELIPYYQEQINNYYNNYLSSKKNIISEVGESMNNIETTSFDKKDFTSQKDRLVNAYLNGTLSLEDLERYTKLLEIKFGIKKTQVPTKTDDVAPTKTDDVAPSKTDDVVPSKTDDVDPAKTDDVAPSKTDDVDPAKTDDVASPKTDDVVPEEKKFHKIIYITNAKEKEKQEILIEEGSLISNPLELEAKRFKLFETWGVKNESGEIIPFDFTTPITKDLELYPIYVRDKSKIMAVAAGVAFGAVAFGVDTLLSSPGIISAGASLGFKVANVFYTDKMSTKGKYVIPERRETKNKTILKIRAAKDKTCEYFSRPKVQENMKLFLKTASISCLVSAGARGVAKLYSYSPKALSEELLAGGMMR